MLTLFNRTSSCLGLRGTFQDIASPTGKIMRNCRFLQPHKRHRNDADEEFGFWAFGLMALVHFTPA